MTRQVCTIATGLMALAAVSLTAPVACAQSADLTLAMMEAKDSRFYYTKADKPTDVDQTKFLLSQLPEDWRVIVDSHSSSPIFLDENTQLVFLALKAGVVDAEYVIDNTPLPNKEVAKVRHREREMKNAQQLDQLMKTNPDIGQKILEKKFTHSGKH